MTDHSGLLVDEPETRVVRQLFAEAEAETLNKRNDLLVGMAAYPPPIDLFIVWSTQKYWKNWLLVVP